MRQDLITAWFPRLVYLILFLLPWQTRFIYDSAFDGEYGTMSLYAVEILITVAFFVGARLHVRREHKMSVKAMGIVLLASALSIPFSLNPDLGLAVWNHLLFAGMLFAVLLDQRVDRWKSMSAYVAGLILPSVLGLYQVAIGSSGASKWLGLALHRASDLGVAVVETDGLRLLRAYGSMTHPNVLGGFLAVGILCALFLHVRKPSSFLPLSSLFLFSFTLIATFSRSAWLAFVAALLVGGGFIVWKHRPLIRARVQSVAVFGLALLTAVAVFHAPLFSRFDSTERLEQISVADRLGQYKTFLSVIDQSGWTGTGIGQYTLALAKAQPDQPTWSYQPIHNVPLLVFAEIGLLGLLVILFWAGSVDKENYTAIRKGSVGAIGGIMLGTVPLTIVFFDHYLWSNWAGLALLSFLMAMTLRLSEDV